MYKILIAEDEPLIRRELSMLADWSALGLDLVGQAENGLHALTMAHTLKPDILLTDVRMPGMDGLTLIEKLQQQYHMQYIIVSGYSDFEYALHALRLGVIDYLLKPIDPLMLEDALKRLVSLMESTHVSALQTNEPRIEIGGYIQQALAYIDEHYAEELNVGVLAKHLHISEGYVSKIFIRGTGMRFSEYVNHHRVLKAIELLQSEKWMIYEVAEMVGYKEYRYFSTVFKNYTHLTPAQFKERLYPPGS